MNTETFEKQVKEIFGGEWIRSYEEDRDSKKVRIELDGEEVSFDRLRALSEFFQTKKINFGTETREGGYCETCWYSYSVVLIRIDEAVFPQ